MEKILFVNGSQVNAVKWNNCIEDSSNGFIYLRYESLNILCAGWDALILGDYEVVMPLPYSSKFGFKYIHSVFFACNLGIIGRFINKEICTKFIKHIPLHYKLWDLDMNEHNDFSHLSKNIAIRWRKNYLLPLSSYESSRKLFSRNTCRLIKKAEQNDYRVELGQHPEEVCNFMRVHYAKVFKNIPLVATENLQMLTAELTIRNEAKIFLLKDNLNTLQGVYIVFCDKKNVYCIVAGCSHSSREDGGFYLLTNEIIKQFCGEKKTIRFEGSDMETIAVFHRKFGATYVEYPHIYKNALPFPFKLFKPNSAASINL